MSQQAFLKLASIAAFITALTTLGVHLIDFQANTFELRLLLARDPLYIFQKWMIIFHCLMVIVSMFGVALVAARNNKGLAALGALFFAVFGVAEITRMFAVLAYLNPLREKYLSTSDGPMQEWLGFQMESFGMAATVLFLLFILAFALGNLFMGMALLKNKGVDRWLAFGFLLWAMLTFMAFGNGFWELEALNSIIEANNTFYQPAIRAAIGWWLWRLRF